MISESTNTKIKNSDERNSDTPSQKRGLRYSGAGFTLIEMMVAVAIFTLVMTAASGIFISGLKNQRRSLSYQQLADQVSYASEYISRSVRMARKELFDHSYTCLSSPDRSYENPGGDTSRLRFIKFDYAEGEDTCHEFFLDDGQLKESKKNLETGQEITQALTSDSLQVNSLTFNLQGATQNDDRQSLITMFLDIQSSGQKPEETVSLRLQTSLSQRNLDIRQ